MSRTPKNTEGDGETGADRGTGGSPAQQTALPAELYGVVAWLVPGLGHWLLGRRARGAVFFGLVIGALAIGVALEGELGVTLAAPPLSVLRTLGCMAAGLPYAFLRFIMDYAGSSQAPGYEYGSAFLVSAGVMNFLLVLDAFDIASGKKA